MSSLGKVLFFCLVLAAATVQPAVSVAPATLDELTRDVDRAESMRSMVKHGYLLPTTDPVKSED